MLRLIEPRSEGIVPPHAGQVACDCARCPKPASLFAPSAWPSFIGVETKVLVPRPFHWAKDGDRSAEVHGSAKDPGAMNRLNVFDEFIHAPVEASGTDPDTGPARVSQVDGAVEFLRSEEL